MMRIAVAGMAHPHAAYVLDELAHGPYELVGTSDPDPANRERWTPQGVPSYADHRELLAAHAPDVVAAFGVYGARAAIVIDALDAGAHVVADKPLCTDQADLDAIERAAARADRHVSVVFEKRWHPVTLAARRLVGEGVLGDLALVAATGPHKLLAPTRPPWFFSADGYGDLLGDLPVHDIDLVLELTGARSGTVSGIAGRRPLPDHPGWTDSGALVLAAGDVAATIEAHWLWPEASDVHGHYRMRLTGTRGVAELDWARSRLTVLTHEREPWDEPLGPGLRPAEQALSALAEGRAPEVTTQASVLATRVALLAARSARDGGRAERWG
ncbi:oxidoreductase domain protein [Beutenbergia cavernae DSM 12333]|uniref:Oxidoreductase domain protein n=1 Tax=Beutenbergia cavernae (strain ATCC BAA-8 / DSM 12333 / CCUG 43141 / JCM 11478 / NBRC 16432 / NCIMB 13614 / HKI 0122) TaxID=471853 RepID=C5C1I2_BEUC1|nr:Gfo/Idh/MocA family oxidoreductase [Beutenbergia cavernae]ACQ81592.1 oxidoreductase domain protein [Beutenbergia cavernae DSM 12333]